MQDILPTLRDHSIPLRPSEFGRAFAAKYRISQLLRFSRVGPVIRRAYDLRKRGGYVRVVNYHSTPTCDLDQLRRHFEFYRTHFVPVSPSELHKALTQGWNADKPGLIISFDDGLRCNYDIARPLLDEFGFTGWFFIPICFIDALPGEQQTFAERNRIPYRQVYADGRIAMSWAELRELSILHVVGSHTMTHCRFSADMTYDRAHHEIVISRRELEDRVGTNIHSFCWVGGEREVYSELPAAVIREAGYEFSFMTNSAPVVKGTDSLQIQRTNIESWWPLHLVEFQLSGLMDLFYTRKRMAVEKATRTSAKFVSADPHGHSLGSEA